jgi:hypothetical protein
MKILEKTKMIWVETPTNPMMNLIDIKSIARQKKLLHLHFQEIIAVKPSLKSSPKNHLIHVDLLLIKLIIKL